MSLGTRCGALVVVLCVGLWAGPSPAQQPEPADSQPATWKDPPDRASNAALPPAKPTERTVSTDETKPRSRAAVKRGGHRERRAKAETARQASRPRVVSRARQKVAEPRPVTKPPKREATHRRPVIAQRVERPFRPYRATHRLALDVDMSEWGELLGGPNRRDIRYAPDADDLD